MKLLTEEEEAAHYREVIKGGLTGGSIGLAIGWLGVSAASRRYTTFRSLTLPFRTFLVTSTSTFGAIVLADRNSIRFAHSKDPMYNYKDEAQRTQELIRANESASDRFLAWGKKNRYSIVFGSWIASMAVSMAIVNRQKYLTGAQRLVQARVYAQALTVLVLVVTAVFEMNDAKKGEGRWETIKVIDPNDPEHKHLIEKRVHKEEYQGQDLWKDMVAAEEKRIKERDQRTEKAAQQ
ncbi:hypothetical protein F5X68DRAFT_59586 [Plectosphaerella plurivora]|uniref:HIG1 domain-containing protein n=1 Tax=Plectosphaerella plurivora TaxID=936078 RepID=A0A9P9AF56_9PEZI|nr:hypothetical protein F5X68DRAFT_59586 [Plectosphaerella plurivora]